MRIVVICCSALLVAVASLASNPRPSLTADAFQVDSVHSSMVFRVKHMGTANFYGRFNSISGSFSLDDDPAKSSFQVQIKTDSVDTANTKRDQHLKSPDFFNAAQFPTISFKSTQVKKVGGEGIDVTGDLTLHGVTKPVIAKVTKTGSGGSRGRAIAGVEAQLTIKRSDFGMTFAADSLGDEVFIIISLEGAKQ